MSAHLVEICNPFKPCETVCTVIKGGVTILQAIKQKYPNWRNFSRPTICVAQGRPIMRAEWDKYIIPEDGVVNLISQPGYAVPAIYWLYALLIVAAVAVAVALPKPQIPGQAPEPDTVFSLAGQRNQIRLSSAIEVPYGRCRLWPSYAAKAYNKYINNDQYQFQLFCLGQGEYDIDVLQIEDTPLANFQDVTVAIYPPGSPVTLFPDNVITSSEVGGIELFGSNESSYTGTSGPFVANPSGSQTTHLEVDVTLPAGLYKADNSGALQLETVQALFEYQQINDAGTPIGAWTNLAFFTRSMRTNTPQRFTLELDVPAGRYQVRGARVNVKNTDSRSSNTVRWEILRAFLPSTKDYGNVTLVAMKAKASNNLNDQAANRFNVWATRKLRIWNGTIWSAATATRSIVWAFADLFQATYGGQLEDQFIKLDDLLALDTIYTGLGWHFDFIFDQAATVWDMARIVARCGRAIPMLQGPQVTMIRDYAKTLPVAIFNQENIVSGSFKHDIKLAQDGDYTGIQIEYTDPDTFLPETVDCLVGTDSTNNLEQIKFPGCTNRDQAFAEGLYIRRQRLLLRETVTFNTGLEGLIPSYGDMFKVTHDVFTTNKQGGLVVSIAGDNKTLTLNEPVTFGAGTNKIALSKKDGSQAGPFTCTAGTTANIVVLASALDPTVFFFDGIHETPRFVFGITNEDGLLCVITSLAPGNDGTVEVKAYVKNDDIYTGDGTPADVLPDVKMPPPPPTVPVLNCASIVTTPSVVDPNKTLVSWAAALGAASYNVEVSADGVTWVPAGNTEATSLEVLSTPDKPFYVRVQPVGGSSGAGGAGAWCLGPNNGNDAERNTVTDTVGGDRYELLTTDDIGDGEVETILECRGKSGYACLIGFLPFDIDPAEDFIKRYRHKKVGDSGDAGIMSHCTFDGIYYADCVNPACGGSCTMVYQGTLSGGEGLYGISVTVDPTGNVQDNGSVCIKGDGTVIFLDTYIRVNWEDITTPGGGHNAFNGDTIPMVIGHKYGFALQVFDGFTSFLGTGVAGCLEFGLPLIPQTVDRWDSVSQYNATTGVLTQTDNSKRIVGNGPKCESLVPNGALPCSNPIDCYSAQNIMDFAGPDYDPLTGEPPITAPDGVNYIYQIINPLDRVTQGIVSCEALSGGPNPDHFKTHGTIHEVLSDEDTNDDAIKRALGGTAFIDLSDAVLDFGTECDPICCRAGISPRTGSTKECFYFRKAKARVGVRPGLLTVGQTYQLKIYYCQRPFGAGTYTPSAVDSVNFTASSSDFSVGYRSAWFEIPVSEGMETIVCKVTLKTYP